MPADRLVRESSKRHGARRARKRSKSMHGGVQVFLLILKRRTRVTLQIEASVVLYALCKYSILVQISFILKKTQKQGLNFKPPGSGWEQAPTRHRTYSLPVGQRGKRAGGAPWAAAAGWPWPCTFRRLRGPAARTASPRAPALPCVTRGRVKWMPSGWLARGGGRNWGELPVGACRHDVRDIQMAILLLKIYSSRHVHVQ
jgi:hypothetical protein